MSNDEDKLNKLNNICRYLEENNPELKNEMLEIMEWIVYLLVENTKFIKENVELFQEIKNGK